MERYMITHSLLSSWKYAMADNPYSDATNEPEDPLADFKRVLRREPTETTEAMQKGIDFENLVTAICDGESSFGFINAVPGHPEYGMVPADITDHKWYQAAYEVSRYVNGGLFQYGASKEIEIDGMSILLYGRLDGLKAGSIYDIKYSGSYDKGKFFDSTQHPIYLELVPDAAEFTYLISNGQNVWTETYRREDVGSIHPLISDFLSWLRLEGLIDTFKEKWLAL